MKMNDMKFAHNKSSGQIVDVTRKDLEELTKRLLNYYDEFGLDDGIITECRELLGAVHRLKDVACSKCGGTGYRVYGSSSTWKGGIGGQVITTDICDSCWGSGRKNVTFGNLRLNRFKDNEE